MGVLDLDHASDENPINQIRDLVGRIEDLERRSPSGFFGWNTLGTGTSGTTMKSPGQVDVPIARDYTIEHHPLAFGRVVALFCALPHVIGVWPMSGMRRDSAVDQGRDMTGAGNHLTNQALSSFGYTAFVPYVAFDGSTQSLYRNDGGAANWADVLGTEGQVDSSVRGLTFGCWVNFDGLTGNSQYPMSKTYPVNGYRTYAWYRDNSRVGYFQVSGNGTALTSVNMGSNIIADNSWKFVVCRFQPSTALTMYVSGDWYHNTSSIPASTFDSSCPLSIGSYWYNISFTGGWMDGKVSLAFLCAAALDDDQIMALYQQSRWMFNDL